MDGGLVASYAECVYMYHTECVVWSVLSGNNSPGEGSGYMIVAYMQDIIRYWANLHIKIHTSTKRRPKYTL